MKTSARLIHYFEKQTDQLLYFFDLPPRRFTPKNFHDIRVAIKHIRSILDLLEKSNPDFPIQKLTRPFNRIFNRAGKVREAQVQLSMIQFLRSTRALEKYATELNERISRHKQSFLTLFRPDLKKQILVSARKIHKALAGIKGKSVKKEFILNQQRFQKILKAPKWKIADVHGLRKQIKIIYHLQKILKPDNTAWQITNEFQERLGAWHDGIVLENGLNKYLESHFLPASEVSSLTKLVKAISIQNEKRFRDILAERKNLVVS